jgi:hypothetical protein
MIKKPLIIKNLTPSRRQIFDYQRLDARRALTKLAPVPLGAQISVNLFFPGGEELILIE